ncbi:MAG TPA: histidine phosphatase family protein [Kiritimatiellia bacterium]|nr:histidine phosphatase family protein [Kiritimatiellia bacterium]
MRIWFIRHAEAVEANVFPGSDLDRPLTAAGRRSAKNLFTHLARIRRAPDLAIASEATRAWETARIFGLCFHLEQHQRSPLLNPGCTAKHFRKLLTSLPAPVELLAVFGHEPDFSAIIGGLIGGTPHSLAMKKGALAEVELVKGKTSGRLLQLIPPDVIP